MKHDPDLRLCRYTPHGWVPVKQGLDSLSKRELQIVQLTGEGLTLAEAAVKMGIKPSSTSTFRLRAMEKLNVPNERRLMLFALANKIAKNPLEHKPDNSKIIKMPMAKSGLVRRKPSSRAVAEV